MASLRQKRVIRGKKINVTYSPSENDKTIQTKGIKTLIMRFIIVSFFKSGCIFSIPILQSEIYLLILYDNSLLLRMIDFASLSKFIAK